MCALRLENASLLKECSEWHYDKKREWIAAAGNGTVAVGFKWFNNEGGWDLEWAHHQGSKCPDTICGTCSEPSVFRKYLRGNQVRGLPVLPLRWPTCHLPLYSRAPPCPPGQNHPARASGVAATFCVGDEATEE